MEDAEEPRNDSEAQQPAADSGWAPTPPGSAGQQAWGWPPPPGTPPVGGYYPPPQRAQGSSDPPGGPVPPGPSNPYGSWGGNYGNDPAGQGAWPGGGGSGGWPGGSGGGWSGGGWGGPGWGGGPPGGPGGPSGPTGWSSPWGQGGGQPRPRRSLPGAITALLLIVAVLVGLGLGHGVWHSAGSNASSGNNNNGGGIFGNPFGGGNSTLPSGGGSGGSNPNANSIAAQVSPALVDINTHLYQGSAAGTGIVLTSNGEVLTNNHVISGATQISATDIGNGRTYTATVLGYDRTHDIALLQLQNASGLKAVTIGDSSKVSVGDQVVGIGNAGGVGGQPTVSPGTVTATNQSITATDEADNTSEQLSGLIQIDANIQQGDSGGALVNSKGQVIGVDTAASAGFTFSNSGGQGFAIPINQAKTVANEISSGTAVSGIHIGPTAFLGVLVSTSNNQPGALLSQVVSNGPAAQAGLTGGDTITALDGQTVDSPSTLTKLILPHHPGDKVTVSWSDSSGQSHQSSVTLGSGPAQ